MEEVLIVLLFAALACGGAWVLVAELRRVSRARNWPTAPGRVLTSTWTAGTGESSIGSYDVHVEYEYSVSGSQYRASKRIFGPAWDLEEAEGKGANLCHLYPIGRELEIKYNPKRPAQGQIADDSQKSANYGLILACVVTIGFFMVVACWEIARW